jgi:xanthine dehydrogenase accessory factor
MKDSIMNTNRWFDALHQCQRDGTSYVLITLLSSAGSTPRENGAKMLITADSEYDTIGGGHLEYEVSEKARQLLLDNRQQQSIEHYPLSSKLGQCCGGATHVLFEVMVNHGQPLTLFGAGHVAKALIPILQQLPLQINWVDSREDLFPDATTKASNVNYLVDDEPSSIVKDLPANSWLLIMTHNHQLDFDIVLNAIKRQDIDYIGMIGSDTKARRFQTRLQHREIDSTQIKRLVSPVGLLDIPGKKPIEVAVSVSAQIIQLLDKIPSNDKIQSKTGDKQRWKDSKMLSALL